MSGISKGTQSMLETLAARRKLLEDRMQQRKSQTPQPSAIRPKIEPPTIPQQTFFGSRDIPTVDVKSESLINGPLWRDKDRATNTKASLQVAQPTESTQFPLLSSSSQTVFGEVRLGIEEHVIALPLNDSNAKTGSLNQKAVYVDHIIRNHEEIDRYLADRGRPKSQETIAEEDTFAFQLLKTAQEISTHPNLICKLPPSNAPDEFEAEFHAMMSSKFKFLKTLMGMVRDLEIKVGIVAEAPIIIDMLEVFFRGIMIYHQRLDRKSIRTPIDEDDVDGVISVLLIPSKGEPISIGRNECCLLIAMDSTFDTGSPSIMRMRRISRDPSNIAPVLRLVGVNTVEHILLCASHPEVGNVRAACIEAVKVLRNDAGVLDQVYEKKLDNAVNSIADWLRQRCRGPLEMPPLPELPLFETIVIATQVENGEKRKRQNSQSQSPPRQETEPTKKRRVLGEPTSADAGVLQISNTSSEQSPETPGAKIPRFMQQSLGPETWIIGQKTPQHPDQSSSRLPRTQSTSQSPLAPETQSVPPVPEIRRKMQDAQELRDPQIKKEYQALENKSFPSVPEAQNNDAVVENQSTDQAALVPGPRLATPLREIRRSEQETPVPLNLVIKREYPEPASEAVVSIPQIQNTITHGLVPKMETVDPEAATQSISRDASVVFIQANNRGASVLEIPDTRLPTPTVKQEYMVSKNHITVPAPEAESENLDILAPATQNTGPAPEIQSTEQDDPIPTISTDNQSVSVSMIQSIQREIPVHQGPTIKQEYPALENSRIVSAPEIQCDSLDALVPQNQSVCPMPETQAVSPLLEIQTNPQDSLAPEIQNDYSVSGMQVIKQESRAFRNQDMPNPQPLSSEADLMMLDVSGAVKMEPKDGVGIDGANGDVEMDEANRNSETESEVDFPIVSSTETELDDLPRETLLLMLKGSIKTMESWIASTGRLQLRYETLRQTSSALQAQIEHQENKLRQSIFRRDRTLSEVADMRVQNTELKSQLEQAHDLLNSSPSSSKAVSILHNNKELEKLVESLQSKINSSEKELEFIRVQYQNASSATLEMRREMMELHQNQVALQRKADDRVLRLHQLRIDNEVAARDSRVEQLEIMIREREERISKLEQERISNPKRGIWGSGRSVSLPRRGSDVPSRANSPNVGSMTHSLRSRQET